MILDTISKKIRIFMNKQIETSLCHIAKFAPFDDVSGASHFQFITQELLI